MAQTMPATAIIHWIPLETRVVGLTHSEVTQFSANTPVLPKRIKRMVDMTMLARSTMARPIKACVRAFLPVAVLPGSPRESMYK